MQLDEKTLTILKNFASIQPNIVFNGTGDIKTVAEAKNILGYATLETFPDKEFGIYDLPEFIATLGLVNSPNLKFKDNHVLIEDVSGRSKINYFYSDINMLTSPARDIQMPSVEVEFMLDIETLNKLKRAAATLGHVEFSIKSSSNEILTLSIMDSTNKTANSFSIEVPGKFDKDVKFNFVFDINNLKLIPGDYDVKMSKKLLAQFINKDSMPVQYYVALEKTSEYKE